MKLFEPRFWRWLLRELEREDFTAEDWIMTGGVTFMVACSLFVVTH